MKVEGLQTLGIFRGNPYQLKSKKTVNSSHSFKKDTLTYLSGTVFELVVRDIEFL